MWTPCPAVGGLFLGLPPHGDGEPSLPFVWVPPGWVVDRFRQLLDKGGVDRHNVTLRASVLLYFESLLKEHAFTNSRAKSSSQTCVTGRRGKVRDERYLLECPAPSRT